jgi:hypothetical protein
MGDHVRAGREIAEDAGWLFLEEAIQYYVNKHFENWSAAQHAPACGLDLLIEFGPLGLLHRVTKPDAVQALLSFQMDAIDALKKWAGTGRLETRDENGAIETGDWPFLEITAECKVLKEVPRGFVCLNVIVNERQWKCLTQQSLERWVRASAAGSAVSTPTEVLLEPPLPDKSLLTDTMPSTTKGRGRHQYGFWPEIENYIFDLLDRHGPPSPDDPELPNQAKLEELVAAFMQKHGWEAAESTIREHVVGMLEYWGTQGR